MKTFFLEFIPSISVSNWLTTLSEAPPASPILPPLALAIESSSSKNTTVGAAALALSKMSLILDSDSPYHILNSSGPLTEMKLADTSVATALAKRVLPVPGGPKNKTPFDGERPNLVFTQCRWVRVTKGKSEVVHGDSQGVKNLCINVLLFEVNQVHLLSNLLHSSLGTKRRDISTNVTMGLRGNGLQIDIVSKLHVLGMNPQHLESSSGIWNTNIDFSVKSTESSQSRINGVWSVGGGNNDNVRSGLHTIHQCQKLRNNSSFNLTVGLVSLWSDRVDFINENDSWRVLLSFLESFSQITFRFTGHLGHNFWTVDQEEESTSLVGDGSGHQGLTGTRRTIH
ncbi:hypothetical protein OGAPHI_005060 [Ogataea philodendri]|uniref:Uncharacterized protein n=1 Tax=Ogataea philodendri TaxID=1378263 RepID=A0A9P8P2S9_9ASCO|nr:uncharacterized protein OGAPHI_005060 [Ogataea philodendri]KAH3663659.1 hypothetical protein OGAPHI_005060 [Ogataea philodendri]